MLTGERLDAANAVYASIDFVPSRAELDRTFGMFEHGEPVALGRVQRHHDGELELGGFWVREDRRRRGIARALVQRVIDELPEGVVVWCVPFHHLTEFYLSFGMEQVDDPSSTPCSIREKMDFCKEQHGAGNYDRTDLLRLRT